MSAVKPKVCSKCGTEYPATLEHFNNQHKKVDGSYTLSARCKNCINANGRKRWAEDRGGVIQKLRDIVITELPDGCLSVQLTRGYSVVIDAIDSDLSVFRWAANDTQWGQYAIRMTKLHGVRTFHLLHRVILKRILGRDLAVGELCDHANGDTLDCRRSNLRLATYADNSRNRKLDKRNTTGYTGIYQVRSGRWIASLMVNKTYVYLGTHDTPEAAHEAYKRGAVEHFGEFARDKPSEGIQVTAAAQTMEAVAS